MADFRELKEMLHRAAGDRVGAREAAPAPVSTLPKVLIVDDDAGVRDALRFALGTAYEIVLAVDAVSGVEQMSEDTAAVILDVKMQGRDGFWAADEIRKRFPDAPIVFHSAYQDVKDPYEVINAHRPYAYVAKGEPLEKLRAAVDGAVKLSARLAEGAALRKRLADIESRMASMKAATEKP